MIGRPLVLAALLLLAACKGRDTAAAALDTGADQRNQTAAKTAADLAAADRAAQSRSGVLSGNSAR